MSSAPIYGVNASTTETISEHLRACDKHFIPPLTGRVDIAAYAEKIASRAQRFEARIDRALVGLVAAYCNDPLRQTAYITTVSVLPKWQGLRIVSRLLEQCIEHAKLSGFARIELKVSKANIPAITLYQEHGFLAVSSDDGWMTMHLNIAT